jgi:hypothetical protein
MIRIHTDEIVSADFPQELINDRLYHWIEWVKYLGEEYGIHPYAKIEMTRYQDYQTRSLCYLIGFVWCWRENDIRPKLSRGDTPKTHKVDPRKIKGRGFLERLYFRLLEGVGKSR